VQRQREVVHGASANGYKVNAHLVFGLKFSRKDTDFLRTLKLKFGIMGYRMIFVSETHAALRAIIHYSLFIVHYSLFIIH
jgi:hypothetical protein